MIEEKIVNYLDSILDVDVYFQMPKNPPKFFVLLEKKGMGKSNKIDKGMLIIQSYGGSLTDSGSSLYEVASLNEKVKEAMENIVILNEIGKCELNSDYQFNDIEIKRYRYQAVFDVVFY